VFTCFILTGLVLAGIRNFGTAGDQFVIFGVEIPLGFDNLEPYFIESLSRAIYKIVPAIILLGGFIPLGDWLTTGGKIGRYKGMAVGSVFAILHGSFLSQLTVLPILAVSYQLLGSFFVPSILMADINAIILGLQLLLWTATLGLVFKSNRGLTVFFAYALGEIGCVMTWGGEFLGDLGVHKTVTSTMVLIGKSLPSSQLPSDSIVWTTLYINLGVPLLLTAILLLFSHKTAKQSRN
jgi:hypothetical protein